MSELLEEIRTQLGQEPPPIYAAYLQRSRELLRGDGLLLYDERSIVERNQTLGVQRFVTDFLAVGDDSGGRLIVVKFADPTAQPFIVDGGALVPQMPPQLLKPLSKSWDEWERSNFAIPEDE